MDPDACLADCSISICLKTGHGKWLILDQSMDLDALPALVHLVGFALPEKHTVLNPVRCREQNRDTILRTNLHDIHRFHQHFLTVIVPVIDVKPGLRQDAHLVAGAGHDDLIHAVDFIYRFANFKHGPQSFLRPFHRTGV